MFETFVSICHSGLSPRRYAGGVLHGDVNNTGGSQRWLITVTVQLTSPRLVVWNFVDNMHGTACSLCNSCA